jgi:hypothetical protein
MSCEKRLRKRRLFDPKDRVVFDVGIMSPATLRSESVVVASVEVPSTVKSPATEKLVDDALVNVSFPV